MYAQQIVRTTCVRAGVGGDVPDGRYEPPRFGHAGERLRNVVGVVLHCDDERHREVFAKQRHRRVLEVATEVGEGTRDCRDDTGRVVPDDADGENWHGYRPASASATSEALRRRIASLYASPGPTCSNSVGG